jgi:membrane AbrB-like protein
VALTLLTFAAAQGVARLASRRGLIGGGIILAMLLTGTVSIATGGILLPPGVDGVLFCLTGVLIGSDVHRRNLLALRDVAPAALLSGALLIVAGVGIARLLEVLRLAPDGGLLATSPGGLHVMVAAAIEQGFDAPSVALFHMTRLFLIVLAIPVLLHLLPGPAPTAVPRSTPLGSEASTVMPGAIPEVPVAGRGLPVPALIGGALAALAALLFLGGSSLAVLSSAVLGAAAANLAWPDRRAMPRFRRSPGLFVQAGIGWLIGRLFTLEMLSGLGRILLGAVVAGALSVLSGVLVALVLRVVRLQPGSDMLATAPGAVEVLPLLADPRNVAPVVVALFHFVRVLMVLAAVPLLLLLER